MQLGVKSANTSQTGSNQSPQLPSTREVGNQAAWSLSSCKPGFGVEQIRDDNYETYWQSDGQLPHLVNIQFKRKTTVSAVAIYTDFRLKPIQPKKYFQIVRVFRGVGSLSKLCWFYTTSPTIQFLKSLQILLQNQCHGTVFPRLSRKVFGIRGVGS